MSQSVIASPKVLHTAKVHTTGSREGTLRSSDARQLASSLTRMQRAAIGFAAGVVGAVAVVLSSHIVFRLGVWVEGPIPFPVAWKSPTIYLPLFWGGLWGIPLGLFLPAVWNRRYLVGFLYFLAPMLATFLYFLPVGGAGYFGLKAAGPAFPLYVMLVNLPFGLVTALVASAIIGKKPEAQVL